MEFPGLTMWSIHHSEASGLIIWWRGLLTECMDLGTKVEVKVVLSLVHPITNLKIFFLTISLTLGFTGN